MEEELCQPLQNENRSESTDHCHGAQEVGGIPLLLNVSNRNNKKLIHQYFMFHDSSCSVEAIITRMHM